MCLPVYLQLQQVLGEGARHKEQTRSLEQQYNALFQQYEVLNQRHTLQGADVKQVPVADVIGSAFAFSTLEIHVC